MSNETQQVQKQPIQVKKEEKQEMIHTKTAEEQKMIFIYKRAKMLSESSMIPKQYQGKVEDCVVAIEMADRTGMSGMAVLQNLDVIHGKPSWSSKFIIGVINQCNRFHPLKYHFDGEGDNYGCTAYTKYKDDDSTVKSPKVTIAMAKEEGWMSKSGSKWKTMPDLMLSYRSASFFGRLHCADLLLGMGHSTEELEDMNNPKQEIILPED